MTPEEEKYYETYFDLFLREGWKQFVQEIEDIIDGYRIEDNKDEKHLNSVKGQLQMLQRVAKFERSIRNAYDYSQERLDDVA